MTGSLQGRCWVCGPRSPGGPVFEARAGPLPEDQVRKGIICQVPFAAARCSTSLGPVSATSANKSLHNLVPSNKHFILLLHNSGEPGIWQERGCAVFTWGLSRSCGPMSAEAAVVQEPWGRTPGGAGSSLLGARLGTEQRPSSTRVTPHTASHAGSPTECPRRTRWKPW